MNRPTGVNHLDSAREDELIRPCQRGDRQAFGRLVLQEQHRICRLVFRIVQRRDDVDDLVQDIFLRVHRSIGTFRFESEFSTWLTRITINECRKALRKRKFGRLLFREDVDLTGDTGPGVLQELEKEEEHEALHEAVRHLPEKQRLVVILHYFEGLTCAKVAEVLECRIGTVLSRLHNARKRLKQYMLDHEKHPETIP